MTSSLPELTARTDVSASGAVARWGPSVAWGFVVLAAGWWTRGGVSGDTGSWRLPLVTIATMAVAAAVARHAPATALALVWSAFGLHIAWGLPLSLADLAPLWVAFAVARWGHAVTVWLGAASIVLAIVPMALWGASRDDFFGLARWFSFVESFPAISPDGYFSFGGWPLLLGVAFVTIMLVPFLLGLLLRTVASGRESRRLRAVAEQSAALAQEHAATERELARLRASQAHLARDVHDAVGHSLAVVLSQSQSAQFLDDPESVRQALANIADTARASLHDIRDVLATTRDDHVAEGGPPRQMDDLIEGVRRAGHDVQVLVVGAPRRLAPDLEVTVYRVTQEMLTNALRHGRSEPNLVVTQRWEGEVLDVVIANDATSDVGAVTARFTPSQGSGIEGMQRRLDQVGGSLSTAVVPGTPADVLRFVATARIPLGAGAA